MRARRKALIISLSLALLLSLSILTLNVSKKASAETIRFTNAYNFKIKQFFSAPVTSGSWNVVDSYGAPMQFYFLDKHETQYDTLQFYVQVQIDVNQAYLRMFNNSEYQGTPTIIVSYLKSNGFYRTYNNYANLSIQEQVFGNIRTNPYDLQGRIVSNSFDTESTSYQLFSYFVTMEKTERLQLVDEYNKGYSEGEEQGMLKGIENAQKNPHDYNLYNLDDINESFNDGLISGREGNSEYQNTLSSAWEGATTLLNTKVLGNITILEIISLPIMLGVFALVLKLLRG